MAVRKNKHRTKGNEMNFFNFSEVNVNPKESDKLVQGNQFVQSLISGGYLHNDRNVTFQNSDSQILVIRNKSKLSEERFVLVKSFF